MEESKLEEQNRHGIDPSYVTRQMIGSFLVSLAIGLGTYGVGWMIVWISRDDGRPVNQAVMWPIIFGVILGIILLLMILTYIFAKLYVNNFDYEISEKFIIIRYGVLTRTKTTIPFSRIQNIAIYQNIRDRLLNIYTVKIETAGSSAATANAQKGIARPEGYIPAVKDPSQLEQMINKLVHQYTQDISPKVKENVFVDNNVAFDEFIAYFLAKTREKDQLKTQIETLRKQGSLSVAQLAEKIGVSETTLKYLEAGEYVPSLTLALRIAKTFNISIEQIFELNS
ncbi:MAG: PH domain-containing protein [Candidatus Heimdallarchaeota archaeon]|nr:PH domain-containing protein [Candidatus Heimdallarchaeota archaeon]